MESAEKHRLFIIGASHFARELESWLEVAPPMESNFILSGFLNSPADNALLKDYPTDLRIVGDWRDFKFKSGDQVLVATTDAAWKKEIYSFLSGKVRFYSYIASSAQIGKFNSFGEGIIICPNCIITTNVKIGNLVTLNSSCGIGHDVILGSYSSLMGGVSLTGGVNVGESCFFGGRAVVIPKCRIGADCYIGAGSIVVNHLRAGSRVFGNPAKHIVVP